MVRYLGGVSKMSNRSWTRMGKRSGANTIELPKTWTYIKAETVLPWTNQLVSVEVANTNEPHTATWIYNSQTQFGEWAIKVTNASICLAICNLGDEDRISEASTTFYYVNEE